ncbi:GNAT family protein [uncultured Thioclava sp.]|uniref:GNAT family N-acetyltransferase n=1 Tax=uncultured Thioclava sp. TaxID=473858 RepID=UPI0034580E1D
MGLEWDHEFGAALGDWHAPPHPADAPDAVLIAGRFMRLERLRPDHAAGLFAAFEGADAVWDYMPHGPFPHLDDLARWITQASTLRDPWFYAVIEAQSGRPLGVLSFLRISPEIGSIELGWITLAPALQGKCAASEAFLAAIRWAFKAGYRRFEWKCDALNLASRRAAQRLGLSYEGTFRQATIYKGRNRDTAWFAAIDADWPALSVAYQTWLDPSNFDATGRQRKRLSDLTKPRLVHVDPILADPPE